jgi:hypothetical protein
MNRLTVNTGVIALVGDRVRSAGAVGAGATNVLRPFLAVRAGSRLPAMGTVEQGTFYVWAHVEPESALAADTILKAVQTALVLPAPAIVGSLVVMECRWMGVSDDLFDDAYGTATRFATVVITARP